jgi:hypothetical protein
MSDNEEQTDFNEIVRLMRKHGWAKVCHLNGRQDCPPYVVSFSSPEVQVEMMRSQISAAMFWQDVKDHGTRKITQGTEGSRS